MVLFELHNMDQRTDEGLHHAQPHVEFGVQFVTSHEPARWYSFANAKLDECPEAQQNH